jgi:hypothetical protein
VKRLPQEESTMLQSLPGRVVSPFQGRGRGRLHADRAARRDADSRDPRLGGAARLLQPEEQGERRQGEGDGPFRPGRDGTCATASNGSYTGCAVEKLQAVEPTLPGAPTTGKEGLAVFVPALGTSYKITVTAGTTANLFYLERTTTGAMKYECTGTGGCSGGVWG